MNPLPVPSLDELITHPERVKGLPLPVLAALQAQLVAVQGTIGAEIAVQVTTRSDGQPAPPPQPDRWLAAEEAAPLLGVTPRWLYRHWKRLPFARKLSRKCLQFSENGLRRWPGPRRT